mmetsp:Transcript_50667/g.136027  ORF Transcript_50667/g.136027 Transcript_50667/m.136027 type:complete len:207 (+) Transcript_50667:82-702(+)
MVRSSLRRALRRGLRRVLARLCERLLRLLHVVVAGPQHQNEPAEAVQDLLHDESTDAECQANQPLPSGQALRVDFEGMGQHRCGNLHHDNLEDHRSEGDHQVERVLGETPPDLPLPAKETGIVFIEDLEKHEDVEQHRVVPRLGPRDGIVAVWLQVRNPLVLPQQENHDADFVDCHADHVREHLLGDDGIVAVRRWTLEQLVGWRL